MTRIQMKNLHISRLVLLTAFVAFVATIASVAALTFTRTNPTSTQNLPRLTNSRSSVTVHAAGRGNPWINLSDGREVLNGGAAGLRQVLEQNLARPLAVSFAGLDLDDVSGPSQEENLLRARLEQTYALEDFNSDSIMDIAVVDFPSNAVLIMVGDGAGKFSASNKLYGNGPRSGVAADFNCDGATDLAITNFFSGDVAIFLGQGSSGFQQPQVVQLEKGLTSMVSQDFDSDGWLDLAVANFLSGDVVILQGRGDGSFEAQGSIGQVHAATLILSRDVDGNGLHDLVVISASGEEAWLLSSEGNGSFQAARSVDPVTAISGERDESLRSTGKLLYAEPYSIRKFSGDGQSGPAGSALRQPLIAEITDQTGLLAKGELVVFSTLFGDTKLDGDSWRLTDEQGEASLKLSLGALPENILITAAIPGGEVTAFGLTSTIAPDLFFNKIRNTLALLKLEQAGVKKQHRILDEAERMLSAGDDVGAVQKLKEMADIAPNEVGEDKDLVDLLKRLINQILLFGSGSTNPESTVDCGSLISGAISAPGEVDQFTFSGQANERKTLTLAASGFPTFVMATATVFSPTAAVVKTFDANSQQQLTLPESGAYVVQVRASNLVSTGSYSVGLECLLPTSPVDATMACGTLLSSRPISAAAQVDQFTFVGQANERKTLTLAASGFPTFVTATATVYSPTAAVVKTFDANSQQQLTLPESGAYVVQVRASNFVSTGSYSLGLECLLPTSPVDATMACGTLLSSRPISAAAQVDQITFCGEANEKKTLTLAASGFPVFRTASATVFSPTAVVVKTFNANSQEQLTLPESGTYVIQIRADDLASTGAYSVGLECACTYMITPTSESLPANGGNRSVVLTAPCSCDWIATSNVSWITIASGSSGRGTGTVNYSVAANPDFTPRVGTMTIAGQTFTVNQAALFISGRVTDSSGAGISDVTITLTNLGSGQTRTAPTDASGNYSFTGLESGPSYLVTPSKTNLSFSPSSQTFVNLTANQTANFVTQAILQFSSASYTIDEGVASATITVSRSSDILSTSSVDYQTNDNFAFVECNVNNGLANQRCDYITSVGTLTFATNETSKTFTVPIIDDSQVEGDETLNLSLSNPVGGTLGSQNTAVLTISDNDTAAPATRLFIAQLNGAQETPPPGTTSTATGLGTLLLSSDETSAQVSLSFNGLSSVQTGAHIHGPAHVEFPGPIVFPLSTGTVVNQTINLTTTQVAQLKAGLFYFNVHTNNFPDGEIRGQILPNPLESARFFVRQQYYDFQSREPDQEGFDFWTKEIVSCSANLACITARRVRVADAFFFEPEFQQTGSYVFRLYRAAYGNTQPDANPEISQLPSYAAFIQDRAQVVGGGDLAQKQLALATTFVQRAEFLTKYPANLSGPQFVDSLLATILSDTTANLSSQRDTLIAHFNSGGRGLVMFHLANDYWNGCGQAPAPCVPAGFGPAVDNRPFVDAEYNRTFVATMYFGFLRRDADLGGYNFWLGQVNSFPLRNPVGQHRMVCGALITSQEYQQRFSTYHPRNDAECAAID